MIKQSFTLRVLALSFLVLALPLLIESFIFFQHSYNHAIKDAKLDLKVAANFRAFILAEIQPLKHVLLKEIDYLLDLGSSPEKLTSEKTNQVLKEIVNKGGEYELFILNLGEEGYYKVLASSLDVLRDKPFTSFVKLSQIVQRGEGIFIRYFYYPKKNKYVPYIFLMRVIKSDETGKPIGLLCIAGNIEKQVNAILTSDERLPYTVNFAVLTEDGVVFAATDPQLLGSFFDPLSLQRQKEIITSTQLGKGITTLTQIPVIQGNDPPYFEFIFADQVQIAYRAYTSDFGISALSYSPKEVFFGRAVRHFLFLYTVYSLILLIGGGVTYWLALWISHPLKQLSHVMGEVAKGNLEVRFRDAPFGFEINILGEIFNQTLVNLLNTIQRTEDERVKVKTYERELAIGREVQRSLLPSKVPEIKGAEVAGFYLLAKEVGGDFYSFIVRPLKTGEEALILAIADAAGKGISACLYAISARSLFRTFANLRDDPAEILSETNRAFMEDVGDTGMFVTLFGGVYHTDSKIFTYYSCGHVPPLVVREGKIELLSETGIALALKDSESYHSSSFQLKSNDVVIFYTNGLTEAVNDHGEKFSQKELMSCLTQEKWATAQAAVVGVISAFKAFTGEVEQEKEVTLVVLKVH